MLDHKRFDEQQEKLALDIRRITAHHAKRLKHLYRNAAEQIYKIGYSDKSVEFHVIGPAPADIVAEIWVAYEQRFSYLLEQKQPLDMAPEKVYKVVLNEGNQ